MGSAIAGRLIEYGFQVYVWNRSPDKVLPYVNQDMVWSDNPFVQCDRVIVSLYSSDIVKEVLETMKRAIRQGQSIIDTTTGAPEDSQRLGKSYASQGVFYLDAPVSGSSEQTRRGEATVMVGGDVQAFEANADLWPVLGRRVFFVGGVGNAAKMKLVSNLVLGLNRAALAEGLAFAESIGVSPSAALEVLKESAAYSKVMDVKGEKMISREFTAAAKLSQHLKDVRLINDSAYRNKLELPLSKAHQQVLSQAEADGLGELDNCSIIEVYRKGIQVYRKGWHE
jgi:3-hydroxyisobutyrate dehydrogenase-like beta-hydroxyacid dehydrogenase